MAKKRLRGHPRYSFTSMYFHQYPGYYTVKLILFNIIQKSVSEIAKLNAEFIELCFKQIEIVAYISRKFRGIEKYDQAPF